MYFPDSTPILSLDPLRRYPDAPHAFFADYGSSYKKDAAEDGWKRLQAWFKKNGVA